MTLLWKATEINVIQWKTQSEEGSECWIKFSASYRVQCYCEILLVYYQCLWQTFWVSLQYIFPMYCVSESNSSVLEEDILFIFSTEKRIYRIMYKPFNRGQRQATLPTTPKTHQKIYYGSTGKIVTHYWALWTPSDQPPYTLKQRMHLQNNTISIYTDTGKFSITVTDNAL